MGVHPGGAEVASAATTVGTVLIVVAVVYLVVGVLTFIAWVRIIQKAGYSGWWVLLGLVPVVNVVMFFVFAFSDWPVLRARRGWVRSADWPVQPGR